MVIAKGELRAVVGPNGAGKTTMLDIITGKTRPDAGRVVWGEDTDLTRLDEADRARLGIGRKFQKPTVFETLSVEANLMLALAGERGVAGEPVPSAERRARRRGSTSSSRSSVSSDGAGAAGGRASATGRSSGWRSACCWRRTRSSCSSTSRRRA